MARRPITGGLFLPATATTATDETGDFPITQDQRHTISTRWRYEIQRSTWIAAGVSYGSGLPTDVEADVNDLAEAYGPGILDRVDVERGRVKPWVSGNVSAGATLRQRGRQALRVQADITNVFDRLNVINFAGLFSGTAVGPRRRLVMRLQVEF